jgi:poly-beta-1,6-N-acetyl-D-glucosamine biosynthesis protein PgaD
MKYEQSKLWPPLINSAYVPVWVQVRDFALTLCGWIVSLYLMKNLWIVSAEYFVDLSSKSYYIDHMDWPMLWMVVRPFFYFSILAIAWISFFAFIRIRTLSKQIKQLKLNPGEMQTHASGPTKISESNQSRFISLLHDAEGKIERVTKRI